MYACMYAAVCVYVCMYVCACMHMYVFPVLYLKHHAFDISPRTEAAMSRASESSPQNLAAGMHSLVQLGLSAVGIR